MNAPDEGAPLPPPARAPQTDPRELAALERRARRTQTRSRVAVAVALVTIVAGAVQAYYSHQPAPAPRQCVEAHP